MRPEREPMENDSNSRTAEELEQQTVDVYVERALHGPVFRMSYEHTHTYCEIFYLKSGTCTYTVNQGQWHLEAGDLFIVAAGDPHSTRYEGKTSCERIIVFCKADVLAGMMRGDPTEVQQALERSCKVILNAETRTMVEALLDQMLLENDLPRKYSEQVLELESLHLVLLLLRNGIFSHETMSPKEGYSADIERALKYIALNYQQPLTLEEVAGYCNLSPTYFSRKFRLITGQTFKEHVNYIRLRQATQMLLMTDNSITKIAMLCGFGSSNYFKDLFRASTGRSPVNTESTPGCPSTPTCGITGNARSAVTKPYFIVQLFQRHAIFIKNAVEQKGVAVARQPRRHQQHRPEYKNAHGKKCYRDHQRGQNRHYIAQRHGNAHLEQRADGVIAPGNQREEHGDKQRPAGQQHYAGKKHCPRKHRTGLQADHQIQYQKDANRQVPHPQRGCLLEVLLKRMEKRGNELAFLPAGHL